MNLLDLFYDHLFCFHTNLLLMKPSNTYSLCKDNITFLIRVDTIKNIVTWGDNIGNTQTCQCLCL
jgi:hypothetical protein